MSSHSLNICLVGCGFMGGKHAEGWSKIPNAKIVAVVDIKEDRAKNYTEKFKAERWLKEYREAINSPDIDAVSVCIPTFLHPEVSIFALEHGKHVLCEKPIALTLKEASRMKEAAERNKRLLGIGFMRQHTPVLNTLRKLLAEMGKPAIYHASDIREVRPKIEMHDVHANGGPVIDMSVHLFDVWSYIFDSQPIEVFAQGVTLAKDRKEMAHIKEKAIDTATITVKYASGDAGTFVVCWGLPPAVNPRQHADQIYTSQGLIEVEFGMTRQEVRVMREGGAWEAVAVCEEDMYHREIANFAQSIFTDTPYPVTAQSGMNALKVSLAALESIRTGMAVKL